MNENELSEQEIIQNLADNTASYKEQLINDGLIQDAQAADEKVQHAVEASNGSIDALNELNNAVITLHDNFANAFVKEAQMQSISNRASKTVSIGAGTVTEHTNSKLDDSFKAELEAQLSQAKSRSSEIEQEIASYYGLRAEILSKVS